MWILNDLSGARSNKDIRTLNIRCHLGGNDECCIFSTLGPHEWYPDDKDNKHILLEFECINEIKNFRDNLDKFLKFYEQKNLELKEKILDDKLKEKNYVE